MIPGKPNKKLLKSQVTLPFPLFPSKLFISRLKKRLLKTKFCETTR